MKFLDGEVEFDYPSMALATIQREPEGTIVARAWGSIGPGGREHNRPTISARFAPNGIFTYEHYPMTFEACDHAAFFFAAGKATSLLPGVRGTGIHGARG